MRLHDNGKFLQGIQSAFSAFFCQTFPLEFLELLQ